MRWLLLSTVIVQKEPCDVATDGAVAAAEQLQVAVVAAVVADVAAVFCPLAMMLQPQLLLQPAGVGAGVRVSGEARK